VEDGPTSADGALEAMFHTWDPQLAADIAAMGVGMAGVASGSAMSLATPAFLSFLPTRSSKPLPHWILLRADGQGIRLFASDRKRQKGLLVKEAARGAFRASLHRNIGDIELLLFFGAQEDVLLKGKWGPFRHQPMRVARAVLGLADQSNSRAIALEPDRPHTSADGRIAARVRPPH